MQEVTFPSGKHLDNETRNSLVGVGTTDSNFRTGDVTIHMMSDPK